MLLTLAAFTAATLLAQAPLPDDVVLRVGNGVKAPVLVHKEEPEYTDAARSSHIQGNVVLDLVVDQNGRATDIVVLSPLGFGLDENAQTALLKWRFKPGTKAGRPVKIAAVVQVNFRLPEYSFDDGFEQKRSDYNVALKS